MCHMHLVPSLLSLVFSPPSLGARLSCRQQLREKSGGTSASKGTMTFYTSKSPKNYVIFLWDETDDSNTERMFIHKLVHLCAAISSLQETKKKNQFPCSVRACSTGKVGQTGCRNSQLPACRFLACSCWSLHSVWKDIYRRRFMAVQTGPDCSWGVDSLLIAAHCCTSAACVHVLCVMCDCWTSSWVCVGVCQHQRERAREGRGRAGL